MSDEGSRLRVALERQWLTAHAGYRTPTSAALAAAALVAMMLLGALHPEAFGVAPRVSLSCLGAMLAANAAALASYHRAGVRTRAYRLLDHVETVTIQLGTVVMIAASDRGVSPFWLVYLGHVSMLPVDPQASRMVRAVVLAGPCSAALYLAALSGSTAAAAFAACGGVAGYFVWGRSQRGKWQVARASAERERLAEAQLRLRVENERARITRELHGAIGGDLTAIRDACGALEGADAAVSTMVADVAACAAAGLSDVRTAVWLVDGPARTWSELAAHMRETLEDQFGAMTELALSVEGSDATAVSAEYGVAVLRTLQESARNAITHGRASRVEACIAMGRRNIVVSVRDNGRGLAGATDARRGSGLGNMRARAEELGGTFSLGVEGGHTVVRLELPLC